MQRDDCRRFAVADEHHRPVAGTEHALQRVDRDCFPSLHTALSAVALVYMWRHTRRLFWWSLPLVVSLWFSTVYLRYHYVRGRLKFGK